MCPLGTGSGMFIWPFRTWFGMLTIWGQVTNLTNLSLYGPSGPDPSGPGSVYVLMGAKACSVFYSYMCARLVRGSYF